MFTYKFNFRQFKGFEIREALLRDTESVALKQNYDPKYLLGLIVVSGPLS